MRLRSREQVFLQSQYLKLSQRTWLNRDDTEGLYRLSNTWLWVRLRMDLSLQLIQSFRASEKTYIVIGCPKCHNWQIAKAEEKHHGCRFCPTRINMSQAQVLKRTHHIEEARAFLLQKQEN